MSYTALYRKFRPDTFLDVKGQDHIVTTLKNQIRANRIGHAYLFTGTRGTGKTTVAKIFAKTVNCESPTEEGPCGECQICRAIAAGPFEIESVIMELPYVLECGVSAAPDEIRGQIVKASIVLTKGTEPTDELKKDIQSYVKKRTAPYKYPRLVEFKTELPKTTSGKIIRSKL